MRVDVSPVGERLELEANPGLGFENIDVGLPIPGGFEEVHGVAGHQVAEVQSQFQVVIELVLHVAVDFHAEVLLFECQPFQIFGRLQIKSGQAELRLLGRLVVKGQLVEEHSLVTDIAAFEEDVVIRQALLEDKTFEKVYIDGEEVIEVPVAAVVVTGGVPGGIGHGRRAEVQSEIGVQQVALDVHIVPGGADIVNRARFIDEVPVDEGFAETGRGRQGTVDTDRQEIEIGIGEKLNFIFDSRIKVGCGNDTSVLLCQV